MQRAIDRQAEGIDGLPSTVPIAAHHCDQEQAKPPLPNFDLTDPELDDKYTAAARQRRVTAAARHRRRNLILSRV